MEEVLVDRLPRIVLFAEWCAQRKRRMEAPALYLTPDT
jgi:hypothetical protein